ncbi:MAG: polymer-forming cytoskeletal protein [Gammaproteobacteria bacterium]|nr:polymer-forming cytoskeletal protein [Gammaproteobacteria bacterium]
MMWPLTFWLLAVLVCSAPFMPALREWLMGSDAAPLVVVREQDTNIRHFAASFFDQIQNFFEREGIDPLAPPPDYEGEFLPGQRFLLLGPDSRPQWSDEIQRTRLVNTLLIGCGDLMVEGGYVYEQEIYCGGQLYGGANATFRAVYAGTDLVLGQNCTVARWLHSQGHVHIGRDCTVYGRISSTSSITLAPGTRFQRLNAEVVRFASDAAVAGGLNRPRPPTIAWTVPDTARRLDERTVSVASDLKLFTATRVDTHLVTHGRLELGTSCELNGNLKAGAALVLGAGCVVRGALVCPGPIVIGPGCLVKGPVVSESEISIAAGSVIGTPGLATTVTAPRIRVESGSQVSGTLWATEQGVVEALARRNAV